MTARQKWLPLLLFGTLGMAFTGLSWHAFIDVPLGMLLCKLILTEAAPAGCTPGATQG